MSSDEKFLDLVQNHHTKGAFERIAPDGSWSYCLLGAQKEAYGEMFVCKTNELIAYLFPEAAEEAAQKLISITPYFNDRYASKEEIILVAKHFVEKLDTIKE